MGMLKFVGFILCQISVKGYEGSTATLPRHVGLVSSGKQSQTAAVTAERHCTKAKMRSSDTDFGTSQALEMSPRCEDLT